MCVCVCVCIFYDCAYVMHIIHIWQAFPALVHILPTCLMSQEFGGHGKVEYAEHYNCSLIASPALPPRVADNGTLVELD